jgi:hypothetical protein
MGYTRRKVKTRRRVKRTKAKNTRKQRRLRNRTFRKSRRINKGGSDPGKSSGMSESKMQDDRIERIEKDTSEPEDREMAKIAKEDAERDAIDKKKDEKIERKRLANVKSGIYRRPLYEDRKSIIVDQTKALENTENQQRFMDEMDAEEVPGGKEGPFFFVTIVT